MIWKCFGTSLLHHIGNRYRLFVATNLLISFVFFIQYLPFKYRRLFCNFLRIPNSCWFVMILSSYILTAWDIETAVGGISLVEPKWKNWPSGTAVERFSSSVVHRLGTNACFLLQNVSDHHSLGISGCLLILGL